ncbi:hypothetical protein SNE40_018239 [Patella caerulea]|uniref:Uncharacterized protein n=1 Tax=Patella caerulea TaxID=87958 RepID=A0AAN8J7A8_PATCE
MSKLKEYIKSGSQKTCAEYQRTKQFSQVFSELCVLDDIVWKGYKVVIPRSLQKRVTELSHKGHQCMTLPKQLLRLLKYIILPSI